MYVLFWCDDQSEILHHKNPSLHPKGDDIRHINYI
jgi:hypothetical protein